MKYLGWCLVSLSLLLVLPSVVPGAMSLLAFYFSLFTLILCIKTIKTHGGKFFKMTMSFTGIGLFIFNDYLRVYGAYEKATWVEKLSLYAIYLTLSLFGLYKIRQHKKLRSVITER